MSLHGGKQKKRTSSDFLDCPLPALTCTDFTSTLDKYSSGGYCHLLLSHTSVLSLQGGNVLPPFSRDENMAPEMSKLESGWTPNWNRLDWTKLDCLRLHWVAWCDSYIHMQGPGGFRWGNHDAPQATLPYNIYVTHKYSSPHGGALYATFIDFESAFDFIPRNKLWAKFESTNIDRQLLLLMTTIWKYPPECPL